MSTWSTKSTLIVSAVVLVWVCMHVVGITYGTQDLPLHQSYVGDEQSPVNGALHMLQEKSVLGLRNITTLYYGPVFATLALPAVVGDFLYQCVSTRTCSAEAYRSSVLWDWGGIVILLRVTSVLASILGLYFLYRLFMTRTFNVLQNRSYALLGVGLVGCNYYFFEYSHFFKHWLFVIVILFAQIYLTVRLRETQGKGVLLWWVHGGLTVMSFGISYISILYSAAFLPVMYALWREGDALVRGYLYRYLAGVFAACLVVLWWHPYAFMRYLGFVGVGGSNNLGDIQNPLAGVGSSWSYYSTEILLNHAPLVLALVILLTVVLRREFRKCVFWLWMFGSVAAITVLLFAPSVHHEGRYMLPTLLMLILACVVAYVYAMEKTMLSKQVRAWVLGMFAVYAAFHVVHVVKWVDIYSDGPPEQQIRSELLEVQQKLENNPIGLVQGYIFGHVHTKEAYAAYIEKRGRQDTNLYKAIMETPLPEGVEPLNVRYVWPQEYAPDQSTIDSYNVVYRLVTPREGEINQFDYMDENILRLWRWDALMPRYERLR